MFLSFITWWRKIFKSNISTSDIQALSDFMRENIDVEFSDLSKVLQGQINSYNTMIDDLLKKMNPRTEIMYKQVRIKIDPIVFPKLQRDQEVDREIKKEYEKSRKRLITILRTYKRLAAMGLQPLQGPHD